MADDTWGDVFNLADGLEQTLRPIGQFLNDKLIDKLGADLGGPIVDVPQKIAGLGPIAAEQLGYGPGDALYDHLADFQQGLDLDPISIPGGGGQTQVIITPAPAVPPAGPGAHPTAPDGPAPPPGDTWSPAYLDP